MLAVAPGTACFLEISLDTAGAVYMSDEAHIGLVDTHAESISGHHDAHLILLPLFLPAILLYIVKTCMKVCGAESCLVKHLGIFLCPSPTAGIDNGSAIDTAKDMNKLGCFVAHPSDDIGEVLTLEAHAEHPAFTKEQALLDIIDNLWCGSSCKSEDWHVRQVFPDIGNSQISRSEVIAPLADAMGLIDTDETHLHVAQLGAEELGR